MCDAAADPRWSRRKHQLSLGQRTFDAPEEELRRMKRRVAIALGGVLVLALHARGIIMVCVDVDSPVVLRPSCC